MMRLAIAGFFHESNTFAPIRATLDHWLAAGVLEGEQVRQRHADANSAVAGFLAYEAEERSVELVPLLYSRLTPSGASTSEAFEYLCERTLTALRERGPFDGVLMPQHGAAVADHHRDADGEFIRRVREAVGPHVPIGVTLDMHANISDQMITHADVVTVYQTNPHIDGRAQGLTCARLIGATVRREIRPVMALAAPPLVVNILRQGTDEDPMARLVTCAQQCKERSRVLSASVVEGFPYADVAEMGMSFLAVTDDAPQLADEVARELAEAAWSECDGFIGDALNPEDAMHDAAAAPTGPVLVLDMGDNVGGGSPGDSTHLLHTARGLGITGLTISIYDPDAVRACATADVAGYVDIAVGGKTDHRHGAPFPVTGHVIAITDGRFEDPTPTHGGARYFDVGPSASLRTDDGNTFAIHSRPVGTTSQQQFRTLGIDPTEAQIIIAKGVHSPRAAFESIATDIIWANTPGATTAELATFDYRHRRRPMFPFESVPVASSQGDRQGTQ